MRSWTTFAFAVTLCALGFPAISYAAVRYTVTDLTTAYGLDTANDINNAGQIAGGCGLVRMTQTGWASYTRRCWTTAA